MKKILLIVACIIAISTSKAQDSEVYKSFFCAETTVWYGMNEIYDYFSNETISTCGDTIIDGQYYKSICKDGSIFGHLREDLFTGKLWGRYRDSYSDIYIETLIADMSLGIGDTSVLCSLDFGVDSIFYIVSDKYTDSNGVNIVLQRIIGLELFDELVFTEGVGSKLLFAYGFSSQTVNSDIYCCEKDGINVYNKTIVGEVENCRRLPIGISETKLDDKINIYPNPTKDWLTIGFLNIKDIVIYNITGKEVLHSINTNNRIDVKSLPQGVYTLKVTTTNKNIYYTKIIKL